MTLKHLFVSPVTDGGDSSLVGPDEWNHDHVLDSTSLQVQYNNAGSLTGMAGTSWDDTNRALTLTGATVTASNPLFNLTQTWNGPLATTNFTAFKINVTNTQSDETSRLFDYQVGGTSVFRGNRQGGLLINLTSADGNVGDANMLIDAGGSTLSGTPVFHVRTPNSGSQKAFQLIRQGDGTGWASFEYFGGHPGFAVSDGSVSRDTQICRYGVATWQFGLVDGAAPVSQTIQAQSVVAGTSNTAGADWTHIASKGTGTGAGGSFIWKTAPAGTSGTSQNSAVQKASLDSNGLYTLADFFQWGGGKRSSADFSKTNDTTLANVTDLSVNVRAGRTYSFRAVLFVSSGASFGGVKAAIAGTATATNIIYSGHSKDTGGTGTHGYAQASSLGGAVASSTPTSDTTTIYIDGTITVNAAGTLTVQAAQNASNGTAAVFARGSYFLVYDVP